ncbi:MAG TPA: CbiX/SirB N-terminal domain-containing protein [Noviherbaspirillum sp.]|jgi:sirohydrochlorin cobaltochelatase|uniref:sirohydrochlorin chelatase n=1 Tax=Noviherbaspirillum sp. TaxID=1926288 RepID=UPI002F94A40F
MAAKALVLFAHGARDARWAEPFLRLRDITQAQMPDVDVRLAFLELMTPRLPELTDELVAQGCTALTVVPVFFGQGGHVLRDLPAMIDVLRARYPGLSLAVAPAVGEDAEVLHAIAAYCVRCTASA